MVYDITFTHIKYRYVLTSIIIKIFVNWLKTNKMGLLYLNELQFFSCLKFKPKKNTQTEDASSLIIF